MAVLGITSTFQNNPLCYLSHIHLNDSSLFPLREKDSSVFLSRKCPHYKYFLPPCQKVKVGAANCLRKAFCWKYASLYDNVVWRIFRSWKRLSFSYRWLLAWERKNILLQTPSSLPPASWSPGICSQLLVPPCYSADCGLWAKFIHLFCAQVHCGRSRLETFLILHNTSCFLQWSPGKKKMQKINHFQSICNVWGKEEFPTNSHTTPYVVITPKQKLCGKSLLN